MTANTLYEAVEPQILWKQLLGPIFTEIVEHGNQFEVSSCFSSCYHIEICCDQAIRMASFILKAFAQDEEIQTIHLPIVFVAILDILDVRRQPFLVIHKLNFLASCSS